ncbi:MAG: hypothetical protein WC529_06415 [Candidatus Margulisiibacteriota bacterium]
MARYFWTALFLLCCLAPLQAATYESQALLNGTNLADFIGDHLGFLYDSHGCLHFTPSDIYLLVRTVPKGAKLTIKSYNQRTLPDGYAAAPVFRKLVTTRGDVNKYADMFKKGNARLVVYPGLGQLFVLVGDQPLVKMKTSPGPAQDYRLVFSADPDGRIGWDSSLSTPTDPGDYKILGTTAHYLSNAYRDITIVPFGGWLVKQKGNWVFQNDDRKWYQAPGFIANDLNQPYGQQTENYLDINLDKQGKITGARWAGNDFGKYALLWTVDGRNRYPELGYCEGQLLYEQSVLIKDLAQLLTVPGPDSLEACIAGNENFKLYRAVHDFLVSSGEVAAASLDPVSCSYVKLFNGFPLNAADKVNIDDRVEKAFRDQRAGKYPLLPDQKQRQLGLYNFVRDYDNVFDKNAGWYVMVRDHWDVLSDLRAKLRRDYNAFGLYSPDNRVIALERFLNDRLEFRQVVIPKRGKPRLTFADFASTAEEQSIFNAREKEALRGLIRAAASGETAVPEISSVQALNDYNFGVLLNAMLGNLYKSHGCMHVSPLNVYILNKVLPVGARITIKPYAEKAPAGYDKLPFLAEMVNFNDDLTGLAAQLADPGSVRAIVYPGSNLWIISLKDKPFARMMIEAGFQQKVNIMQGRDKNGYPLFAKDIAYPTPPGSYSVLRKVDNYVSNLYYDTTVVPQGAQLKKTGGNWSYRKTDGSWGNVPDAINDDLNGSRRERTYEYYDLGRDDNDKLVRAKWGSNTFGRFPILLTKDGRTPAPELVHTTGDLMMEQRRLVGDLIRVMASTFESFNAATAASRNFDLYTICYQFTQDPQRADLLEPIESGSYKAYLDLPLNADEQAALPPDVIACFKLYKGKEPLTQAEADLLVREGLARWQGGTLKVDDAKAYGVLYDLYQYVVSIRKNANIYSTLQDNWNALADIRQAMLRDLGRLRIKDPAVFAELMRELITERAQMERLTQKDAYRILDEQLEDN